MGEAIARALVTARIDGAADVTEFSTETEADGQARLEFDMPPACRSRTRAGHRGHASGFQRPAEIPVACKAARAHRLSSVLHGSCFDLEAEMDTTISIVVNGENREANPGAMVTDLLVTPWLGFRPRGHRAQPGNSPSPRLGANASGTGRPLRNRAIRRRRLTPQFKKTGAPGRINPFERRTCGKFPYDLFLSSRYFFQGFQ